MANFLDKISIPTAVEHSTPMDLSCDHITTSNWMQYNVAYAKELVPNEHINIDMTTFTRLEPLVAPTFGRANVYNRAFFVPFRTVWGKSTWNNFITDTPCVNSTGSTMVQTVPTITAQVFLDFFRNSKCSSAVTTGMTTATTVATDFVDLSTATGYKLTAYGRQAMKILNSLGYAFLFSDGDDSTYSALPILSVLKIYMDWYFANAYAEDGTFMAAQQMFQKQTSWALAVQDLISIFDIISRVCYDSDYFTSCFDNPAGPNTGLYSNQQLPDVTNNATYKFTVVNSQGGSASPGANTAKPNNGTPFVGGTNTTAVGTYYAHGVLTQYTLDALKAMTDYLKRHQLVGGRAMDRYLSRFGINLSTEKLDRSTYLGTDAVPLQIGDVMSNSDTSGAVLGSYAGKGIAYGGSDFEFTADEYGMLIIISTIIPKIGYYQGQDRATMRVSKLDYYTPEYDGLGAEAVSARELYVPMNDIAAAGSYGDNINTTTFGWLPRYASYKVGRDRLTGDFRYGTINAGEDSWHLMREFNTTEFPSATAITHNRQFMVGADADQYSRIFNQTNADIADKFRVIYHFDVKSQLPMSSLFDNYHFEEEGKEVRENVGGVKMN